MIDVLSCLLDDLENENLKDCSFEKSSCDFVSKSMKTRFEIKCHRNAQKYKSGEDKFMMDVKAHLYDKVIRLCEKSRIKRKFDVILICFTLPGL